MKRASMSVWHTALVGATDWRQVLGDIELPDGMAEFFDELHGSGWYIRSRWGDSSVRVWPDDGRRYQTTIDLRFPLNEHRRAAVREAVRAHQSATQSRGGQ